MKRFEIQEKLNALSEELESEELDINSKEYKTKLRQYKILAFKYKLHFPYFWIVLAVFLALSTYTVFHTATNRLFIKSVVETWDSLVYYFKSMFSPVPIDNSGVSFLVFDNSIMESVLPTNIEVFGYRFLASFQIMANPTHLGDAWSSFVYWLNQALVIVMLIGLPIGIMIFMYYNKVIFKFNNREASYESKTLYFLRRMKEKVGKLIRAEYK